MVAARNMGKIMLSMKKSQNEHDGRWEKLKRLREVDKLEWIHDIKSEILLDDCISCED